MASVSFQAPTDYAAEQEQIARSRKYAELLQAQSMEAQGPTETVGGWAIRKSPLEGLAKMLKGYSASKMMESADDKQKTLADRIRQQGLADVSSFTGALQGTPARPEIPANEMDYMGTAAAPAQAPDRSKALAIALQSQNPMVQGAGSSILKDMLSPGEWKLGERFNEKTGKAEKFMYDPKNPTKQIAVGGEQGVSADTRAKLDQSSQQWSALSANQQIQAAMEAAKLGISVQELLLKRANAANTGLETQFNTGSGVVPGMPQIPAIPQVPQAGVQITPQSPQMPAQMPPQAQGAPMPPRVAQAPQQAPMAPQAPVNPALAALTPKARAEIAKEQAQQAIGGTKDANSVLNLMDGVEKLIDKAHGSGVGNMVGGVQNFLGISSDKNNADAQLKALEGALVSKMPKMSGPQSDKDVLLYRQMAGELGNPSLPADVRKAAAETVRGIQRTYLNGFSATGYQPDNSGYNGPDRRSTSGKIKRYNPATGTIE